MPRWQKKLLQDRRGRAEFAALLRVTEIPGVSSKAAQAQRAGESCTQLFSYYPLYVAFGFFCIQKLNLVGLIQMKGCFNLKSPLGYALG